MKTPLTIIALAMVIVSSCNRQPSNMLFTSEKYSIFRDSVIQEPYKAVAISGTEIHSDYISPVSHQVNSLIRFKFSINSRDNEMPAGMDHYVNLIPKDGKVETPPIKFGQQYIDTTNLPVTELPTETRWTVKLDLNDMLKAFKDKGYYELYNGSKIYSSDFKGVYIAGAVEPLSWDFENLSNNPGYRLTDDNNDGIYEATILLNPSLEKKSNSTWKLSTDVSAFPEFHSDNMLIDALYNMSLEEMMKDIRPDSTFMAGEKWDGVWTRDISYSILLSLAIVNPEISKNSLLRKVKNKRIIQDTGSGGSWPISIDRLTWALAAWEIYTVTGDKEWLQQAYEIIKNSVADDKLAAFDEQTGLMHGESSFLDWREQTYPKWMEPIDIYESENLGTNAVHYQAYRILAEAARILNEPSAEFDAMALKIKTGINKHLWMEKEGYYAQYVFGKYSLEMSPRSESLGEALCVLFDVADSLRQEKVITSTPVTEYGIPCIFPQIPDIQPYHNNAVWPFVEAYWTLASAKARNETSVLHGLGAIYRQSALFLTNKENFVAENGDFLGTAINSNRQLWSVAGNLAMVYKLYFGMEFKPDGIEFNPCVPRSFGGKMELSNFNYRGFKLTVILTGYGNSIKNFKIDGKESVTAFLPGDLSGNHQVEIELANNEVQASGINLQALTFSPFPANPPKKENLEFLVFEMESFAPASDRSLVGFSGKGFVELSKQKNTSIHFTINVPEEGKYVIDFRYSNGSGPVNTDNKCAIRTLKLNDEIAGPVIMPQRGKDEWSNWGYSNAVSINITKGENHFDLVFEAWDENMNGEVNTAMVDQVRLLRTGNPAN